MWGYGVYKSVGVAAGKLYPIPLLCIHNLFELLRSPFTPPQPSPYKGEGVRSPPLYKGGLGG